MLKDWERKAISAERIDLTSELSNVTLRIVLKKHNRINIILSIITPICKIIIQLLKYRKRCPSVYNITL
jgi:peroxiredoxin